MSEQQAIRTLVRELGAELTILARQVAVREEIREGDLSCLELLARTGPMTPAALAKAAHLLPPAVDQVLDRLEQGGRIERRRDSNDGRSILIYALANRTRELSANYAGLNTAIDKLCGGYSEKELAVVADFLGQLNSAVRGASTELALGVR